MSLMIVMYINTVVVWYITYYKKKKVRNYSTETAGETYKVVNVK